MSVVTFGVDATKIAVLLPQVPIVASGPVTSARLTDIINSNAAAVNAVLIHSYDDGSPAAIAADVSSVPYLLCQKLVALACEADILFAIRGVYNDEVMSAYERRDDLLEAITVSPVSMTGYQPAAGYSPGVGTSTKRLGLSVTDADRRDRRKYDGASSLSSKDEDSFIF
jgi:hypothetical protein